MSRRTAQGGGEWGPSLRGRGGLVILGFGVSGGGVGGGDLGGWVVGCRGGVLAFAYGNLGLSTALVLLAARRIGGNPYSRSGRPERLPCATSWGLS